MMTSEERALVESCVEVLNALCDRRDVSPVEGDTVAEPLLRNLAEKVNRLALPGNGAVVEAIGQAGKLCHEINQPLTAIMSATTAMRTASRLRERRSTKAMMPRAIDTGAQKTPMIGTSTQRDQHGPRGVTRRKLDAFSPRGRIRHRLRCQ